MKVRTKENLVGFLLVFVLVFSIANEFLYNKISQNYQDQRNYDLKLVQAYGETSALYQEVSILLQRNFAAVLNGIWQKPIGSTPWFDKDNFDSDEKFNKWKDKSVEEFWIDSYYKVWDQLQLSLKATNELRKNPPNFLEKNQGLENWQTFFRIIQLILISTSIYLYLNLIVKLR